MNYKALISAIADLHQEAVGRAAAAVNQTLVLRNWVIGAYLVEYEQRGVDRAAYGLRLLARLSEDLRQRDVKGTSADMLERMRLFYLQYPQMAGHISAPLVRKCLSVSISAPAARKYATAGLARKLFVSRYLVALPKPEKLQRLLEAEHAHFTIHPALSLRKPGRRRADKGGVT